MATVIERTPLFFPGEVCPSPGVISKLQPHDLVFAVVRHCTGDWGEVCAEDYHANNNALRSGERLLGVYRGFPTTRQPQGQTFYLLTDGDRSVTAAMLPREFAEIVGGEASLTAQNEHAADARSELVQALDSADERGKARPKLSVLDGGIADNAREEEE